jgi:hypothetical protein
MLDGSLVRLDRTLMFIDGGLVTLTICRKLGLDTGNAFLRCRQHRFVAFTRAVGFPGTAAAPATAADFAKLNDTIAKLTATVDRLNQQLAERDRPAKPSGSSSSPSPTSDTARRQEIYGRQMWRRSLWREPMCSW